MEATFEVILEIFKDVSHVEWELLALGYMVLTDLVASPVRKAKIPNTEIPAIILDLLENKEPRLRSMVAESLESLPIMIFRGHDGSDGEVMQFFDALINPILGRSRNASQGKSPPGQPRLVLRLIFLWMIQVVGKIWKLA